MMDDIMVEALLDEELDYVCGGAHLRNAADNPYTYDFQQQDESAMIRNKKRHPKD